MLDIARAAALLELPTDGDHVVIERYDVIRQLGRGSTGAVFLARDRELGGDVALKVLARWMCADPLASQRFLNEVRAVSSIASPRIVSVIRSGATDDGQLFIAMEYLDGVTLRARLNQGPLTESETLAIAIDVADGLRAAHEHGIIHRDIKPENILLTAHGACIVDFGIAKLDGETQTRPGAVLGTAAYMRPEQARGDVVDHRTDLWSMGIVLHEMLTGERPFGSDVSADVLRRIRNDDATPIATLPSHMSPRLHRVLRCCLEKHRDGRYSSAAALQTRSRCARVGHDVALGRDAAPAAGASCLRFLHDASVQAQPALTRRRCRARRRRLLVDAQYFADRCLVAVVCDVQRTALPELQARGMCQRRGDRAACSVPCNLDDRSRTIQERGTGVLQHIHRAVAVNGKIENRGEAAQHNLGRLSLDDAIDHRRAGQERHTRQRADIQIPVGAA